MIYLEMRFGGKNQLGYNLVRPALPRSPYLSATGSDLLFWFVFRSTSPVRAIET